MIVAINDEKWRATRAYLHETAGRFAGLVSSAARGARATRHWSVADTAAHVRSLSRACASLVAPAVGPEPFDGFGELLRSTTVDTVADFNEVLLRRFTERDPETLARMVRADVDRILETTEGGDPARAVPWLGGSHVPLAGVLAHMLNELQIHGRDVARAARMPWSVPDGEAAMFFELFLMGVTHYGYGRLLEGHGQWPRRRVAVEFRSPYTTTRTMALDDGLVTVEKPEGETDVRLSFRPAALNLMLFGRIGKARAALTGDVVVRGPRPWLLPAFLRIVRLPS